MTGLFPAGVLLAKTAAHTPDTANLSYLRPSDGIVAKNMDCRRRGDKLDYAPWADTYALSATDAKTLFDLSKPIYD
jgi:hypothetical protein